MNCRSAAIIWPINRRIGLPWLGGALRVPHVLGNLGNLGVGDTRNGSVVAVLWIASLFCPGGVRDDMAGAEQFVCVELFGP